MGRIRNQVASAVIAPITAAREDRSIVIRKKGNSMSELFRARCTQGKLVITDDAISIELMGKPKQIMYRSSLTRIDSKLAVPSIMGQGGGTNLTFHGRGGEVLHANLVRPNIAQEIVGFLQHPQQQQWQQPPVVLPQPQSDTYSQPQWQQPQFHAQPTGQFGQPVSPLQQPPKRNSTSTWFRRQSLKAKFGIIGGSIIGALLLCTLCGVISNATGIFANATPTPTANTQQVVDQPTQSDNTVLDTPTDQPTIAAPTPTQKPKPTPIPTHAPLPTPRPTQPPPKPTPCPGINCNPWGYNFSPGNKIFNPPSSFCTYFNCIPSFWGSDDPGDGYINECVDGTYSQSGGERGDCSSHGGELRPLYSH
jgi:hypothetical protein